MQTLSNQNPLQVRLQSLLTHLASLDPAEQLFALDRFREELLHKPLPELLSYRQAIFQLAPQTKAGFPGQSDPLQALQDNLCAAIVYATDKVSGSFGPQPEPLQAGPVTSLEPDQTDW